MLNPEKNLEAPHEPLELAGQMVVAGFKGKRMSRELERALKEGAISGVILFERNLGAPAEIRKLTDLIRKHSPRPPFIAIDQEGGRVLRLKEPFTAWPAARALGEKFDAGLAREVAKAMALEMRAVGINLTLAPVADVDSNPANPVINDRSFSPDPVRASRMAAAMIEGFSAAGLISCAKHFPGHGDTEIDSHEDLAVIDADRTTLTRRELRPFVEAIAARVPMIMAGHLKARALDPYYPASISRAMLHDILRIELGFTGVIVTDDLQMGALKKNLNLTDAAFNAARAGADLVLVCSGLEAARIARDAIAEGIKQGVLNFGELALSARRVLDLKQKLLTAPPPESSSMNKIIGNEKHRKLARMETG